MKRKLGVAIAVTGCLVVAMSVAFIVLRPQPDPHEQALANLNLQGNIPAQVRILSARLVEEGLAWAEAVELYERMADIIGELDAETRSEISHLWLGAAVPVALRAVEEEAWEVASAAFTDADDAITSSRKSLSSFTDLLDIRYLHARLQAIIAAASNLTIEPAEFEAQILRLAKQAAILDLDYVPLFHTALSQLSFDATANEGLELVACRQASWAAYASGDEASFEKLIEHEVRLHPGVATAVQLPAEILTNLGERGTLWLVARPYGLALNAFQDERLNIAFAAFELVDEAIAESRKPVTFFDELLDDQYLRVETSTLVAFARSGGLSAADLQDKLTGLLQNAAALTLAAEKAIPLQTILAALGEGIVSENLDVERVVSREQAYLSLAADRPIDGLLYWETAARMRDVAVNAYTLQELLLHPEIARFSVEGNGTYTSIDIHFTYVSTEINVILFPCVFRYSGGSGYQDMAVYRVEQWTVSAPVVKTVPALCLDFDAKTPKRGVSDYVIEELGNYITVDRDLLLQRLYVLELIETSLQRFTELELSGAWDSIRVVHPSVWEQVRAFVIWDLTNPGEATLLSAVYTQQATILSSHIAQNLSCPYWIPSDVWDLILSEVSYILSTHARLTWDQFIKSNILDRLELDSQQWEYLYRQLHEYISRDGDELVDLKSTCYEEAFTDVSAVIEWLGNFGFDL